MSSVQSGDIAKSISCQLVRAIDFGNRDRSVSSSDIEKLLGIGNNTGVEPGATWQAHLRDDRFFELNDLSALIDKAADAQLIPSMAAAEIRLRLARLTAMSSEERTDPLLPVAKQYADSQQAAAMAIRLALAGKPFIFNTTDTGFEVVVTLAHAAILEKPLRSSFMVVQQGGSSSELYLHAHESEADAEADRIDCAENGAYETSPIVEAPAPLSELGEVFYSAVEGILQASKEMECVDRPSPRMKP